MYADSPTFPLLLTPIFKTHIATRLLPIAYPRLYYYAHPCHLRTYSPEKSTHTIRTRHDVEMIIPPLLLQNRVTLSKRRNNSERSTQIMKSTQAYTGDMEDTHLACGRTV